MDEQRSGAPEDVVVIEAHEASGTWVVVVRGELDLAACRLVHDAVASAKAAACERIAIDLREVTFFDCGGLRVLLDAAHASGTPVWLLEPSRAVRRVAEIVGIGPDGWHGDPPDGEVRLA